MVFRGNGGGRGHLSLTEYKRGGPYGWGRVNFTVIQRKSCML